MMIQNLKLSYKILVLPLLFIIVLVGVLVLFYSVNNTNSAQLNSIENGYIPYVEMSSEMNTTMKNLQRGFQDAVAATDMEKLDATHALKLKFDSFLENTAKINIIKIDTSVNEVKENFNEYYKIAYTTSAKMIQGTYDDETTSQIQVMMSKYQNIDKLLIQINTDSKTRMKALFKQTEENNARTETVMHIGMIMVLIFIALIAFIAYQTNISTVKPLKEFTTNLNKLSEGELNIAIETHYLNRKDEIGIAYSSLDRLIDKLTEVVSKVQTGIDTVSESGNELLERAEELSNRANIQATSTEEISASMEEMTSSISLNSDNAQFAEKITTKISQNVIVVDESTRKSIDAITLIASKVTIINDIAFQTNLLALNAAVEAARAGDMGKGFAVVAIEVRRLAERSREAADEINAISKSSVNQSIEAGKLVSDIIPEINNALKLIREIASSSLEQSSGTSQINDSLQGLNSITQLNSETSERLAYNADGLASQSNILKDLISYFKIQ